MRTLAVFCEDYAGLLAAVDLWFSGELASDQVDGAAVLEQGVGQAEDLDEDGAVEFGSGGVFVDLVEGQESFVAEEVELSLGLGVLLVGESAPDGFNRPTPESVRESLKVPIEAANFRITRSEWLDAKQAPSTTWGGRLVKGGQ